MLTTTDIADALPKHLKTAATQDLADRVNTISTDSEVAQNIRENFISYTGVLTEGKFRTEDYLNAVSCVSYKLMGHTNQESYRRAFPQRYQNLIAKGMTEKDILSLRGGLPQGQAGQPDHGTDPGPGLGSEPGILPEGNQCAGQANA